MCCAKCRCSFFQGQVLQGGPTGRLDHRHAGREPRRSGSLESATEPLPDHDIGSRLRARLHQEAARCGAVHEALHNLGLTGCNLSSVSARASSLPGELTADGLLARARREFNLSCIELRPDRTTSFPTRLPQGLRTGLGGELRAIGRAARRCA